MNEARLQALREQERLFGRNATLSDICLLVRAAANGSADPWTDDQINETLALLRIRLATWQEINGPGKRLDDAVKEMILATIEEVNNYLK